MKLHTSKEWFLSRVDGEAGLEIGVGCEESCSPSSDTPRMDKAAYKATTRTVGKWIVPLAKAQHIERELAKITEKAEHLAVALVTGNDAIESLTRDLLTVIEAARRSMPKKHGTIERIAETLP